MAERTGIAWTDHTFNPWVGCTTISPGCDHCYAEEWAKRTGNSLLWAGARRRTTPRNWLQPIKWNRQAQRDGVRRKVFCASLADVFDNQVPASWRDDLWHLIHQTPDLDWLLLTKRPQNIAKMLPDGWGDDGWPNVWLGTTVENQEEADRRIWVLAGVRAVVRFLSCEPLLGPVSTPYLSLHRNADSPLLWRSGGAIDWVIIGGESGPGARPMEAAWAGTLLHACWGAHVPVFFKQVGSNRTAEWPAAITGKGDDPAQWPEGMRAQEFPIPRLVVPF